MYTNALRWSGATSETPDMTTLNTVATPKRLYTPREAARHLDIGLTSLYALLKRGELNAVKLGSLTKIPAESIEAFIAALPARAR
jgi:excisionase family DNA binding protein